MNFFDVCLTANQSYAAPTAVTASVLANRKNEGVRKVYMIWAEKHEPPKELLNYLEKSDVELVQMPFNLISKLGQSSYFHIPSTTLARLFLHEILGKYSIGNFFYVDGDTDIIAPLTPLCNLALKHQEFAAVGIREEMLPSRMGERRATWDKHVNGIGLKAEDGYFNAGAIFGEMKGYGEISEEAFSYFVKNREQCIYLDQDALNAVSVGRRKFLSPRFNFQKSFFNMGIENKLDPVVVHYNGFWKPWRPTPFCRSWKSRKHFIGSWSEMPTLWPKTWPLSQAWSSVFTYHASAIKHELQGRKKAAARRHELQAYFEKTEFADGKVSLL